jgi:hypothetical protein
MFLPLFCAIIACPNLRRLASALPFFAVRFTSSSGSITRRIVPDPLYFFAKLG